MTVIWTALAPIWKVLVVGLIAGAGLPAVFAMGMRLTSPSAAGVESESAVPAASRIGGVICYLIVALVVALGLFVLVAPSSVLTHFGLS